MSINYYTYFYLVTCEISRRILEAINIWKLVYSANEHVS